MLRGCVFFSPFNSVEWATLQQAIQGMIYNVNNQIVTPEGFEPPTNRAEICHSIQLNYGALFCFFRDAKVRFLDRVLEKLYT